MARIPVVVDGQQKSRWSDYVEDHGEVDNLSDLIRTAVEVYMATPDDEDGFDEKEIETIIEYLDTIDSATDRIEEDIDQLNRDVIDKEQIEDIFLFGQGQLQTAIEQGVKKAIEEGDIEGGDIDE